METISNDPLDQTSAHPQLDEKAIGVEKETLSPDVNQGDESGNQPSDSPATAEDQVAQTEAQEAKAARKNRIDNRFKDLTSKAYQAQQELAQEREARQRAEEELSQYRAKPANRPVYENYSDPYTYAEDLAKWQSETTAREVEAKIHRQYADRQEREQQVQWLAKQNEAMKEYEDYEEVVSSATAQVSKELELAIIESDLGPHLLYRLADDDALVAKLQRLPTASALRELGKIEASIEAQRLIKKTVKGSSAPEPISPLRTSTKMNTDSYIDHGDGAAIVDNATNYRRMRESGKIR